MLVAARVERIGQAEQIAGQALAAAASAGPDAEREALVALAWARVLGGRGVADLAERASPRCSAAATRPPNTSRARASSPRKVRRTPAGRSTEL